jgi:hypothetical protein
MRLVACDSLGRIPKWGRVFPLLLIWGISWAVSVFSCRVQLGYLTSVELNLWSWTGFWFAWPLSFGGVLGGIWLPSGLAKFVLIVCAISFWPCYLTLMVLALKTGKVLYFALLSAMNLFASVDWLYLTVIGMSA